MEYNFNNGVGKLPFYRFISSGLSVVSMPIALLDDEHSADYARRLVPLARASVLVVRADGTPLGEVSASGVLTSADATFEYGVQAVKRRTGIQL
jgi:hypothetical protein